MIRSRLWRQLSRCWWSRLLPALVAAAVPSALAATVSAPLSWTASSDTNVTGYNIYYGNASGHYTNSFAVGLVTNTVIPGLQENTTYFFAAKSHNAAGNESEFSNEAAFVGVVATTEGTLRLKATTNVFGGDPLTFSLAADAPVGVTINPTNGTVIWTPGRDYASTTNYITVIVTDANNPGLSLPETLSVAVGDYLEFRLSTVAVSAGQSGSLPLTVASSSNVTNVQITLAWPVSQLPNPSLTFLPPVVSGSLQNVNDQLVIELQTAPNQPLSGTNQVAQINFQAAAGQPSAILGVPINNAAGLTAQGASYVNVLSPAGEVVVVGSQPLLRPNATAGPAGRTLSLYANPGNYRLLSATSLAPPVNWRPLVTYQQTNVAQTVALDAAEPVIFYRLQQL